MADTRQGTVKWFDNKKGYGFITPEDGGSDLFVHMSGILMEGYKTLTEEQTVTYEVGTSDRGPIATKVTPQRENYHTIGLTAINLKNKRIEIDRRKVV